MNGGIEWLIDGFECDPRLLADRQAVEAVCDAVIQELRLHVIGSPAWHQFPDPGGVTGMYLLRESHLTCHTFPEHGLATFNLYCCRPRPSLDWVEVLNVGLGSGRVEVRTVHRGLMETVAQIAIGGREAGE